MPTQFQLRLRTLLCWGVLFAMLAIPAFANDYQQFIVNSIVISALVTLSFTLVVGSLGQLAFANTAFFGLGAYGSAMLVHWLDLPWLATIPLAGLCGLAGGFVASAAALRGIRLYYLAIVTLAFGELMRWLYLHGAPVTGGTDGLALPAGTLFGWRLDNDRVQFYVFLAVAVPLVKGTLNLLRSRIGRAIVAVRENELAAASLGISTARLIVVTFMWSGFIAGCAGALFARHVGHVFAESFGMLQLLTSFAMVLVGGIGSVLGAILGSLALTALPEYLRAFPGMEELFFGVIVAAVLVLMPDGLAGLLRRLSPLFTERHYRE